MSETISNIAFAGKSARPFAALNVEVIADLICPYCYLGKRQLDEAMHAVHGPSDISWYPYQINPQMPAEGMTFDDYLASRFGSKASIQPTLDSLVDDGRKVGIEFRFDRIRQVPNTLLAHQLMQLAADSGADQTRLAEMLMYAFFERGDDIGDKDALIALGIRAGLPRDQIVAALHSDKTREFVLAREAQVRASGITGAPGFLVNRQLLVVGAHDADYLVNVFDRAMFGEVDEALKAIQLN